MSLDWFLNDILSKLDRGFLLERQTRQQVVNYLNTIIEEIKGENSDGQEECKQIVSALLNFHKASKLKNKDVCLLGKYHDILYVAAKLCYLRRLQHADTVSTLLRHVYECENTFERFFENAIFGVKVTQLISGWRSDYRTRAENLNACLYFVQRTATCKLRFETKNFVDIPMTCYGRVSPLKAAVKTEQWDLVTMLVKHGAITYVPFGDEDHEMYAIFPLLVQKLEAYAEDDRRYADGSVLYVVNGLRMVLGTVPSVHHVWRVEKEQDYRRLVEMVEVLEKFSIAGSVKGPCTLKHLARCATRVGLAQAHLLPVRRDQLEVPESVRGYLNLDLDC